MNIAQRRNDILNQQPPTRNSDHIAPYNPINNIANSDVLNSIADVFAKIEKYDLKVEKVTLEQDRYDELITKRGSLEYLCQNNHGLEITEEQALIGALWGAELEIADESKVYGERGFIPSGPDNCINNPMVKIFLSTDVNYRMEVEIKFDTPMTKESEAAIAETLRFQRKILRLKNNMTIIVHSRAQPIRIAEQNEMTALDTLREMITEAEFRKYMVHGFILVKGKSGCVYQIYRNRVHTIVWENGEIIEEICVRIKDRKIPPTDNVIVFKILIETSEDEFKKLGNVYNMAA